MRYNTPFRFSAWTILSLLFVVTSLDPVGGSGATWQTTPPPTLVSFVGEDLSLEYEYNTPHYADPRCRVTLGYYAGGSTVDILVKGDLDPITGDIDVEEQAHPDRLNVTSNLRGFTFHLGNLSLSDSGQYLVDIRFNHYDYLHHAVVLTVYNYPRFLTSPSPNNVVMEQGSNVTMSWTLSDLPSQPPIDLLQINHTVQDVNYTLVDQRLLPDGRWSITYPEEQNRFKRRILYAAASTLESIDFIIRQLQPGDSGTYSVIIVNESGVNKLQDTVNLQVSMIPFVTDIAWIYFPSDPTYIVESSERTLMFTAHLSNETISQFELSKMSSGAKGKLLASMVISEDNKPEQIESIWNPDWTFSYNSSSSSVLVKITNIQMQDAGRYTFDIRNGSGEMLAHYQFTILILNDSLLNPEIEVSMSDHDTMSLTIRGDSSICTPLITLYDESGTTHAFAETSKLVMCIPQTQEQVLVVVEYECDAFHHKIEQPLNLKDLVWSGKDKTVSRAGPDDLHLFLTTPAMTDIQCTTGNVQFKVIVSLGIISGALIVLLQVCIIYLGKRLMSHFTEAKKKMNSYISNDTSDYNLEHKTNPSRAYDERNHCRWNSDVSADPCPSLNIPSYGIRLPTDSPSPLSTEHHSVGLNETDETDIDIFKVPVMRESSGTKLSLNHLSWEGEEPTRPSSNLSVMINID